MITLLGDPANSALTEDVALLTMEDCNGRNLVWLSEGLAAEFELSNALAHEQVIWENLQAERIDMVIQPKAGRKKQLLIADMDSTMIEQECIDELADEAGIGDKVAEITARAMDGKLDFEAAMKERVGLIAGLDLGAIDRVLENRITYTPGGKELIATMSANGAHCALVSGGFTDFTQKVASHLGFHEHKANILHKDDTTLLGTVEEPILGREAKVEALKQMASARGLSMDKTMAVGDGANDLGMLQLAGSGVALHAKPSVAAQSKIRLNFADLKGLLYLQGYCDDDFAI